LVGESKGAARDTKEGKVRNRKHRKRKGLPREVVRNRENRTSEERP